MDNPVKAKLGIMDTVAMLIKNAYMEGWVDRDLNDYTINKTVEEQWENSDSYKELGKYVDTSTL